MEKNSQRKREEAAKTSAAAASATPMATGTLQNLHTQAGSTEVLDGRAAEADAITSVPPLDYAVETDKGMHQTSIDAQMDIPRQSIEVSLIEPYGVNSLLNYLQNSSDTIDPDTQINGSKKEDDQADGVKDSGSMEQNGGVGEPQSSIGQWPLNGGSGMAMPNGALALNGVNAVLPMDLSQMMQYMPGGMPNSLMGAYPNTMGAYAVAYENGASTNKML